MSTERLHILAQRDGQTLYKGIHEEFPIIIGRSPDCHVLVAAQFISRNHCSITVDGTELRICDLGSKHKLLDHGVVTTEIRLPASGEFYIGDIKFDLRLETNAFSSLKSPLVKPPTLQVIAGDRPVLTRATNTRSTRATSTRSTPTSSVAVSRPHTTVVPSRPPPMAHGSAALKNPPAAPEYAAAAGAATIIHAVPDRHHDTEYFPLFVGALGLFEWKLDEGVLATPQNQLALQAAISWGPHIFDVRNYILGDKVRINPKLNEDISLPYLKSVLDVGRYSKDGAAFGLDKDLSWTLSKLGNIIPLDQLAGEKRLTQSKTRLNIVLKKDEILTVHFTKEIKSHFRYIRKPRPNYPRTWIENKEEFKKAIQVSVAIHFLVSLASIISAPKSKAPVTEHVPERFARLLVEPPAKPLAVEPPPKPPEPIPVPPPPPPPLVVEVKPPPEPPKPKPKPKPLPKPVVEKKVAPVKPVVMKEPVKAVTPAPKTPVVAVKEVKEQPKTAAPPSKAPPMAGPVAPAKPPAPEPSPAEREAAAMADLLNSMPTTGAGGPPVPGNVKIAKSGGAALPGIKVGGMVGAVPSNGGPVVSGIGHSPGALAAAGQGGFAATSGGSAGKRGVKAVLAEAPSFKGGDQGLDQDSIMKVINAHVSEIQRCYERALFDHPQLVGRIEYEWTITPTGGVSDSNVKRSDMSDADGLNHCVTKVIKSLKFPASKNGLPTVTSVGFPFGKQ